MFPLDKWSFLCKDFVKCGKLFEKAPRQQIFIDSSIEVWVLVHYFHNGF